MEPNDAHITPKETAHLRELLETRLDAMEKLVEEKFRARDQALDLMSESTNEHLVKLNGEAARLLAAISLMEEKYLPRETYNTTIRVLLGALVTFALAMIVWFLTK